MMMMSPSSCAEDSRVVHMCGIPLALMRAKHGLQKLPRSAELDNQAATYLMIDPATGFAPADWQWNIGEVTVFRRDGKPFTNGHFWVLWDLLSCALEDYGDSVPPAKIRARYFSPTGFRRWLKQRYTDEDDEAKLEW
jgi:hypothetical protein